MRSKLGRRWLLPAAALAMALGCSSPQSYVILLLASTGSGPITGVARVEVDIMKASQPLRVLTYPARDLSISADASVAGMGTLSVSFSADQIGDVEFDVKALDAQGCAIGKGAAIITIKKGATVEGVVPLTAEHVCPADAGADGGGNLGFPGCDPVHPVCADGQTCQVNCGAKLNACTAGGTGAPGTACQGNASCAPGSQCFDYSSLGCGTKICLRFCETDTDCGGASDGGAGPGSFCRDPVTCSDSTVTAYRTCSASCDPTAAAALSGNSACPAGLACLLPGGMDQVACACPEASRKGTEGTVCHGATDCAPGFICEQTCRAVCRCDLRNGVCTAANDCPTAGTSCTGIKGEVRFGVCL